MSDPDTPTSPSQPSQTSVYRRYMLLQSIAAARFPEAPANSLAGLLLICVGFGLEGAELALATTICGGTFLGIDPSAELLKAAVRNGSCDFMVNTLDESLRALKNELRKKKALSVGLLGDATAILPAMVERGVQPDLVADALACSSETAANPYRTALRQLVERGAISVDTQAASCSHATGSLEVIWTAASLVDLRRMDELAIQQFPVGDSIGRRWLQQAPGSFYRQRPLQRVVGMGQAELMQLAEVFRNAISAGEIQSSSALHQQTADGSKQSIPLFRP